MAVLSLFELAAMTIEHAQSLPFEQRDGLLDLIIAEGRHLSTELVSYRTGLYSDYFDEDLTRMLKVRAIKVLCRGTTSSGFDGMVVGQSVKDQYQAAFRHVQTTLVAAQTSFSRVVTLVVFLTDMEQWPLFNEVYKEFVPSQPCRAVIGTTGLAQKPLAIEIVECIAYRVAT